MKLDSESTLQENFDRIMKDPNIICDICKHIWYAGENGADELVKLLATSVLKGFEIVKGQKAKKIPSTNVFYDKNYHQKKVKDTVIGLAFATMKKKKNNKLYVHGRSYVHGRIRISGVRFTGVLTRMSPVQISEFS